MSKDKKDVGQGGTSRGNASHPKKDFEPQEKASIGGAFNSGVTSGDAQEKEEIEKKATLKRDQPPSADEEAANRTEQQTGENEKSRDQ